MARTKIYDPAPPDHKIQMYVGFEQFVAPAQARGVLNEWVLSLVLDGRVGYTVGIDSFYLEKHDAMLMRPRVNQFWELRAKGSKYPGAPPGVTQLGTWDVVFAVFTPPPAWLAWLDFPMGDQGYFRTSLADSPRARRRMAAAMMKAYRLHIGGQARHRELVLQAIGEAALWLREATTPAADPMDARVTRAVEFMNRRLHEPVTLDEVAYAALASRSQLSLVFQERLGMSPMRYFETLRIERAKQMLTLTPHPIKHIARAVGYEDPKYFVKRFRLSAGATPKRFRARAGGA